MEQREGDMLVNLYALPPREEPPQGFTICRAFSGDRERILAKLRTLAPAWAGEVSVALSKTPSSCFLAFSAGRPVGFACYDATARGYFGPTGVTPACRGRGVGRALLLAALYAMRDDGYGYAVIGWAGEAAPFYEKAVGARFIEGGEPENTLYSCTLSMQKKRR